MRKIDIIIPTLKRYVDIQPQVEEINKNTPERHRVIATCQPIHAAINRNLGLDYSSTDIVVMMDDDITFFWPGWLTALVAPLQSVELALMVSARLVNPDGLSQMGMSEKQVGEAHFPAENNRISTGCFAMDWKTVKSKGTRFDEGYKGSGYEDTDFCQQLKRSFGTSRVWVNNRCPLTHLNEMKEQGGEHFKHNHERYMTKWPGDLAVKGQTDWTKEE